MLLGSDYLEKFGGFIICKTRELVAGIPNREVKGEDAVGMVAEVKEMRTIDHEQQDVPAPVGNVRLTEEMVIFTAANRNGGSGRRRLVSSRLGAPSS